MPLSEAALAAIGAGAAAAGSIGSAGISSARNKRIARYSANFQKQQIMEQNLYNRPIMQMARYQEAGLNPNLIYGNIESGQQGQIAKYEAPDLPTPDLGPVLGGIAQAAMNFALQRKDLQLKDQELRNKLEEQFNLRSARMAIDIENAWKAVITGFDPGLVMDESNRHGILASRRMSDYDLGIQGKEVLNAMHQAQKDLANLDVQYRGRVLNEMFDLQKKLLEKQAEGKDLQNAILEVEKKLQEDLSNLGGKGGVKIIIDFLRAIFR